VSGLAPEVSGGWPGLGHLVEFRRDPVGLLRRGQREHGAVFAFRLPRTRVTVLAGPEAHGTFFNAADDVLSVREVYRFTVPIFGAGVVYDVPPEMLDAQMGFIMPALRDERLRAYARVMQEEAEAYFEAWGDEGEADLPSTLNELTVFIAARCLIGDELRQRLSREFAHLYHDLEGGIDVVAFFNPYLPLPAFRRRDRARARLGALVAGIMAERRREGRGGEDVLDALMTARYADGRALTDDEITGLLVALVFAGQHTSAVLAAWTGVLLLGHADHLAAVVDERHRVLGDAAVTLPALRDLVRLDRCIKEAERLHPPLVMLMRKVLRDVEVEGRVAPAGGLAMVSPALSHRLADVFTEPDRYDPDRFGPGRQEDRRHRHALIGFGGGHHRCIGSAFAYQQIKVIWSVLLRRFDLELVDPDVRPDYATFVVGPRPPCRVRYRRRPGTVPAGVARQAARG
jgi:sterol 14-demethylase